MSDCRGFPHERLHQEARFIFVQVLIRYKTLYKTVEKLDFRSDLQSEGSEESLREHVTYAEHLY
ncbi:hypothetical protein [Moorena producens]|uniref:hypothetical protein n=1 Tax=Moorena producens TaxID=1155739 RepID=UPI003C771519